MKVLIDTTTIAKRHSGTGIYTRGLLGSIQQWPGLDGITAIGGDREMIGRSPSIRHLRPDAHDWHRIINLAMLANLPNYDADVAFFPNYFLPAGFSIPSIVTIHDVSFVTHPHLYSRRFALYYRQRIRHTVTSAAAVLTVSEASREAIVSRLGIQPEKVHVISPGPSIEKPAEMLPAAADRPFFLYVGTIEPKKNIACMIDGFLASGITTHDLLLVGRPHRSPAHFEDIDRRLKRAEPRVRHRESLPGDELASLYARCDGVVNLSFAEGFSFPIRDALHFRKPVLVSRDAALREITGGHGVSVDERNPEAVSEGFRRLLDAGADEGYALHCRTLDRTGNWRTFADRVQVLTEEILRPAPSPTAVFSPVLSEIQQAVVRSVCYAETFGMPVRVSRLHRSLFRKACTDEEVQRATADLVLAFPDRFRLESGFLSFRNLQVSTVDMLEGQRNHKRFLESHRWLIAALRSLPWCRHMFFSGGTVHGTACGRPDIDLFVVARNDRVWLLFTLIRLLSILTGKQRIICNNYMVDEAAAAISHVRDEYAAFELIHLEPVSPGDDLNRLLRQNPWVSSFFPNAAPQPQEAISVARSGRCRPMTLLNLVLMGIWTHRWKRMGLRNLSGGVLWDAHRIKLHVLDHRPAILARFTLQLERASAYLGSLVLRRTA